MVFGDAMNEILQTEKKKLREAVLARRPAACDTQGRIGCDPQESLCIAGLRNGKLGADVHGFWLGN